MKVTSAVLTYGTIGGSMALIIGLGFAGTASQIFEVMGFGILGGATVGAIIGEPIESDVTQEKEQADTPDKSSAQGGMG